MFYRSVTADQHDNVEDIINNSVADECNSFDSNLVFVPPGEVVR